MSPRRPSLSTTSAPKALHAAGRWLLDTDGRTVLLRGVNLGGDGKIPPFLPFHGAASAAQIHGWGLNCVRCVTVWEAIEQQPGVYDEDYLDRLAQRVDWLTEHGIFVILDMHQDLFSRALGGDGAPAWAVTPLTSDSARLLTAAGPEWFFNYSAAPVIDAFARFWTDATLQEHFLGALHRLARRFAGNPLVIGYEILNEPWPGRFDLASGEFEQRHLAPFYEKAIAAVRRADPTALLFFEPATLAGGLIMMQSRLPPLAGRDLVYAPHFYPPGAIMGNEPDVDLAITAIERDLDLVVEKAAELGVPALLGEFGVHPRQADGLRYVRGYYEALDRHLLGGTIWHYAQKDDWNQEAMSLVGPDLSERPFVEAVVRPYPQAVAGEPLSLSFDAAGGALRLVFRETGVRAPTLIHLPERVYPLPGQVTVTTSDGTHEFDVASRRLSHYAGQDVAEHWIEVRRTG